jgi:predicted RNA-binding protein with PUA-like domain
MAQRKYWLMKSEPDVYGIDDLERDGSTHWDGVRNYQARNYMRDEMKVGDGVLYYHSRAEPMAIVGLAEVAKTAYPDFTQLDPESDYYDPKAREDDPRWFMVDVRFVAKLARPLTLDELKADSKLDGMLLLRKGQRLSIQPVEAKHWKHVLKLAGYKE